MCAAIFGRPIYVQPKFYCFSPINSIDHVCDHFHISVSVYSYATPVAKYWCWFPWNRQEYRAVQDRSIGRVQTRRSDTTNNIKITGYRTLNWFGHFYLKFTEIVVFSQQIRVAVIFISHFTEIDNVYFSAASNYVDVLGFWIAAIRNKILRKIWYDSVAQVHKSLFDKTCKGDKFFNWFAECE